MPFPYGFIHICIYTLERRSKQQNSPKLQNLHLRNQFTIKRFRIPGLCTESQTVIWFRSAALPCVQWNRTSSQQLKYLETPSKAFNSFIFYVAEHLSSLNSHTCQASLPKLCTGCLGNSILKAATMTAGSPTCGHHLCSRVQNNVRFRDTFLSTKSTTGTTSPFGNAGSNPIRKVKKM